MPIEVQAQKPKPISLWVPLLAFVVSIIIFAALVGLAWAACRIGGLL